MAYDALMKLMMDDVVVLERLRPNGHGRLLRLEVLDGKTSWVDTMFRPNESPTETIVTSERACDLIENAIESRRADDKIRRAEILSVMAHLMGKGINVKNPIENPKDHNPFPA